MKKLILLFITTTFLLTIANANDRGILSLIKGDKRKVTNGRYWNGLNGDAKMAYLLAFGEGEFEYSMMLTTQNISDELKMSKDDLHKMDGAVLDKLNLHKNIKEIINYVDKFYSNPLNLNIPIHFAITTLTLTQNGGNAEPMINMLRENSISTDN